MGKRSYGQFCGLARAADLIGERWALLIIRDLLVGPRRFTDLRRGLPRIPTNVLSTRLKQLEAEGVVARRVLPRPEGSVVYELTGYGRDLEEIVLTLGRWGARTLGEPGEDDIITTDSLVMALRSTFRAHAAREVAASFELHVGDIVVGIRVDHGKLDVIEGTRPGADLTIETGPGIKAIMAGEITPSEAVETGVVQITGEPALLTTFATVFRISNP